MSPNKAAARARWLVAMLMDVWPMLSGSVRRELIESITRSVARAGEPPSECPPPASSSIPVPPPGMPPGGI